MARRKSRKLTAQRRKFKEAAKKCSRLARAGKVRYQTCMKRELRK